MSFRSRLVIVLTLPLALAWGCSRPVPPSGPAFDRREVRIPMRDGVALYAVIMSPRAAHEPLPILLERTPYWAGAWQENEPVPRRYAALARDGYVFVEENIRGRGRSGGGFEMNRPNRARTDTTGTDESTDAWDTVEWLIHNVPGNDGKVGIFGISYPGWLTEEALIGAHPAVKAISPQAPMADTWLGDDFFHQGAFREAFDFEAAWFFEAEQARAGPLPGADAYAWYLAFPTQEALTDSTRALRLPTWRRFVEHPAYDSVWQRRAFARVVTGVSVPTLTVGGFWDQEDMFGAQATYRALERFDTAGVNHVVLGPWYHGEWARESGDSLGNLQWGSATSDTFQLEMQAPWFAFWLHGKGDGRFPEARVFDGGRKAWRAFDRWPPRDARPQDIYLRADRALSFTRPAERAGFDAYVSDPANPVPYLPRPIAPITGPGSRWRRWLTEDQRFVEGRPDVLTYKSAPLERDVTIAGDITAHLEAATTGSDADWVVKLIDVFPDSGSRDPEVTARPRMAGYELMVAADIMRGRYRESWERPGPIPPDSVESYTVDLHQQFYTFRRGHRIAVQVQSSWFPLYDRNPQTWVPNIFLAPPGAYRAQTMRIYRTAARPSRVEITALPR